VIGILPGRIVTRQRLLVGVLIVAGASLFNLIALEIGPFGSPWPLALLWVVCGWSGLGPNVTTATLLFALGLWVDVLTGSPLGTWAAIVLISHAISLAMTRFLGTGSLGRMGSAILTGAVMLLVMLVVGFWRDRSFYVLGAVLPLIGAIGLYPFVGDLFELSEDET
jgi:hypothetical protein